MRVHLEPYNSTRLAHFAVTRASLQQVLQDAPVISIEHVGSTSIPRLLAESIFDTDIICRGEDLGLVRKAMVEAGMFIEERWVFWTGSLSTSLI